MDVDQRERQSVAVGALWARLWPAAKRRENQPIRRGAWYPVVQRDQRSVALQTETGRVILDIPQVELRNRQPDRFTIVRLSKNEPNPARGTPRNLGLRYAVCPNCRSRVPALSRSARLVCRDCGHSGDIEEI